jgi:hypothetical protein
MATELPEYHQWLLSPEIQTAMHEINSDVHRHAAVLAGALVEDQLKRLIERSTMPVLEKTFRRIGYHQCLNWAYRFGLIDKNCMTNCRASLE